VSAQLDRDWWNGESEEGEASTRSESLGSAQVVCLSWRVDDSDWLFRPLCVDWLLYVDWSQTWVVYTLFVSSDILWLANFEKGGVSLICIPPMRSLLRGRMTLETPRPFWQEPGLWLAGNVYHSDIWHTTSYPFSHFQRKFIRSRYSKISKDAVGALSFRSGFLQTPVHMLAYGTNMRPGLRKTGLGTPSYSLNCCDIVWLGWCRWGGGKSDKTVTLPRNALPIHVTILITIIR
jgi:hypothetical protein